MANVNHIAKVMAELSGTRLGKALIAVLVQINEGGEFPDVIAKVARVHNVSPLRLAHAYDDYHADRDAT